MLKFFSLKRLTSVPYNRFLKIYRYIQLRKTRSLLSTSSTQLSSCMLCGSTHLSNISQIDRYGLPIKTLKCTACSIAYNSPYPTPAFDQAFYGSGLYRDLYQGPRFLRKPSSDNGLSKSPKLSALLNRAGVSEYLASIENSSILEIGCASATPLVDLSKQLSIKNVFLLEPDPYYSTAFGSNITSVSSLDSLKHNVDAVIMMHCLEHVSGFMEMLYGIYNILSAGGFLCIEVPNLEAYSSGWYYHVAHPVHFSQKAIAKIALKIGFDFIYTDSNSSDRYDERSGLFVVFRKSE